MSETSREVSVIIPYFNLRTSIMMYVIQKRIKEKREGVLENNILGCACARCICQDAEIDYIIVPIDFPQL